MFLSYKKIQIPTSAFIFSMSEYFYFLWYANFINFQIESSFLISGTISWSFALPSSRKKRYFEPKLIDAFNSGNYIFWRKYYHQITLLQNSVFLLMSELRSLFSISRKKFECGGYIYFTFLSAHTFSATLPKAQNTYS